jgi:hypothetical protein
LVLMLVMNSHNANGRFLLTHAIHKLMEEETGRKIREVMNECAAYSKQFPPSQRIRAYKDCLKSKLRS